MPTRNYDYWLTKFQRNMDRDRSNDHKLQRIGWKVIRVWEHEVNDLELAEHAVLRVKSAVRRPSGGIAVPSPQSEM